MGFGWIVQVGLFDIAFRGSCIAGYTYAPTGYSLLLASPCGNSGISCWISHQGPLPGSPLSRQRVLYQPSSFDARKRTDPWCGVELETLVTDSWSLVDQWKMSVLGGFAAKGGE